HLGAMSSAVQFQAELYKGQLQEGDVLVSNHPGGRRAGSMPPFSKTIEQEGAQILSFKLVKQGSILDALNISDLKAQVSANYQGATLIHTLIEELSLEVVEFYITAIQNTAEAAMRELLCFVDKKFGGKPLKATDYMVDGEELRLKISIDPKCGEVVFDFTGDAL
ncbi:Hydantoinase B/oxoprolinase-domain-containing protein, partial [Armillaria borealis]